MKHLFQIFVMGAFVAVLATLAFAEVPQMINYQGKLTTATGGCLNDTVQMTFSIYPDSLGTFADWTETQIDVVVKDGVFSVLLGSVDSIPASVFDGSTKYLGVQVESDNEMRPLKAMVTTGYAFRSQEADTAEYARTAPAMPDDDWVIDGDNIYHEHGRVGIGTTSPSAKLDIVETSLSNNLLRIKGTTDAEVRFLVEDDQDGKGQITKSNWDVAGFSMVNKDDGSATNIGTTNGDINFRIGPPDWSWEDESLIKLHISGTTGNVGIGTTSPASRLELVGDATIKAEINEGFALLGFDSKNNLGQPVNTGQIFGVCSQGASDARLGFNIINSNGTGWTEALTLKNGGNVGIGTTSPGAKLDVSGNVNINGYVDVAGGWGRQRIQGYVETGNSFVLVEGENGVILRSKYPSSNDVFVLRNDNVGIGTTFPAFKLDVNGDIRSTGTIYGNFSGTIDNALHWNNHSWGDLYPNADKVDGIHGTQFLRNDQSGTLNGSLTVNGPGGSVNAITANTNGTYSGVAGLNTGTGPGVYAESYSTSSIVGAVTGKGKSTGPGVYAESNATKSNVGAVTGKAKVDGGSGVYGETWSLGVAGDGSSVAVFGWAPGTGESVGGAAMGVLGRVNSYQGPSGEVPTGVFGEAMADEGAAWGVAGETYSDDVSAAGVKGTLMHPDAEGRAIWGEAPSSGYAGYFNGRVHATGDITCSGINCTGGKSAIVSSSKGQIHVYSQESPEVWFEDFSEGELKNGYAHIDLSGLFLETVTISQKHPMKVFVQLNDDCKGVYVKRGNTGFDVYELNNGKSNAHFSYRIVAKRKGFEDKRLEKVEQQLSSK